MKFKLHWIESHVCYTDEEVKEWEDSLPNAEADGGYGEVVDFSCMDIIEADSIEEAKIKVREYDCYDNVFSLNLDGETVFDDTEMGN